MSVTTVAFVIRNKTRVALSSFLSWTSDGHMTQSVSGQRADGSHHITSTPPSKNDLFSSFPPHSSVVSITSRRRHFYFFRVLFSSLFPSVSSLPSLHSPLHCLLLSLDSN